MRVDPNYVAGLVSSLNDSTLTQQQLTRELSSGLRVSSLSDDPVAAGQASLLGSAISQDDTFVQNAATTQSLMQVADAALGSVVTQITSALSLAVEGNNGTSDASQLKTIAQQLTSIRDQVVSLANTSYQGTYVFAGSQGQTAPFTVDASTSPPLATYHGDLITGSLTTPGGQTISTSLAGSSVFTASGADVLGTLNSLIAEFSSGSSSTRSVTDTASLKSALSNVSQQRASLDGSLNRIEGASSYAQTDSTQRVAAQSTLVAADTASVATQLSASTTQREALMSVIASVEKGSLFDYTH